MRRAGYNRWPHGLLYDGRQMPLEIRIRDIEGVKILELDGRLVAGEETTRFRQLMEMLLDQGDVRVVLDLANVSHIDSTGLGCLVVWHTRLQRAGGALKLCRMNARAIELMVLTKLYTVLDIFDDCQDAVNSFFPGRQARRFDLLEFVQRARRSGTEAG